jgi:hypothetical protein
MSPARRRTSALEKNVLRGSPTSRTFFTQSVMIEKDVEGAECVSM